MDAKKIKERPEQLQCAELIKSININLRIILEAITLDQGDLLIRGEKNAETEVKEENYYRKEQSYGSFYRRLALPFETTAEQIKATYAEGVLEIRIPKPATEVPPTPQTVAIS